MADSPGRVIPRSNRMRDVYDAAYRTVPNWEIGRPQQAFRWLDDRGLIRSPVLDVGCGTGELTMYLAARGYDALGIDISGRAIQQARTKAEGRRSAARFLQLDAMGVDRLAAAGFQFRTVLDSATSHVFGRWERERYVAGLGAVTEPGGIVCLFGDRPRDATSSYGITPEELRDRFERAGGWESVFAYRTVMERRYSRNDAYLVGFRRLE